MRLFCPIICVASLLPMAASLGKEDRPDPEPKVQCRPVIIVLTNEPDPTIGYASEELLSFVKVPLVYTPTEPNSSRTEVMSVFSLDIDHDLKPGTFSVSSELGQDDRIDVKLRGADSACVLHAVYTVLERMGICFDALGPIVPETLDLDALIGWNVTIRPAVAKRGIRQHINFPMDISSYPLPEAKEYIRNLARMRFNHMTFHSYGGQWVPWQRANGKQALAGSFFYGQRHDLPESPHACDVIRNDKTYCIPEIEPYYDQPEERSRRAVEWLQAVMQQAKTVGMTLQFSIQAPDNSLDDGLAACRSVLKTYPLTRTLELVTGETFGKGGKQPIVEQQKQIAGLFGQEVADDPGVVAALDENRAPLWNAIRSFAGNLKVAKALKKELTNAAGPSFALGAYVTDPQTLKVIVAIMRRVVPSDMTYTFLPAHGSRAAVDAMKFVKLTPDDWRRTMMYTWIEFDGNIYLQQNVVEGTKQMLELARESLEDEPIPGVLFNHWRTAENRTAFRYAARACIEGPIEPAAFYNDYARALGLGKPLVYAEAMAMLDDVDNKGRDELFNIGFCFRGCWFGAPGLGWTRGWKTGDVVAARAGFRTVRDLLAECIRGTTTDAGKEYLRLLDNRLECTDVHLQAIDHLLQLHPLVDDKAPEKVDAKTRAKVLEHTQAAAELARRYMLLHSQAIADRGCEGTLLSYCVTIPPYIERARKTFAPELDASRQEKND